MLEVLCWIWKWMRSGVVVNYKWLYWEFFILQILLVAFLKHIIDIFWNESNTATEDSNWQFTFIELLFIKVVWRLRLPFLNLMFAYMLMWSLVLVRSFLLYGRSYWAISRNLWAWSASAIFLVDVVSYSQLGTYRSLDLSVTNTQKSQDDHMQYTVLLPKYSDS